MNKHEKKFHNTHTKICQALLELIENTEYDQITVSSICSQARINRTTFYAHFQNVTDILDIINSGLLNTFIKENNIEYLPTFKPDKYANDPYIILNRQDLLKFLLFVKKHARLYSIIVKHRSILQLGLPEDDIKHDIFIPSMSKYPFLSTTDLDYIFDFYVAGVQKITSKWILGGCVEDETKIIQLIDLCLYKQI